VGATADGEATVGKGAAADEEATVDEEAAAKEVAAEEAGVEEVGFDEAAEGMAVGEVYAVTQAVTPASFSLAFCPLVVLPLWKALQLHDPVPVICR
jgi:hypothetical protein